MDVGSVASHRVELVNRCIVQLVQYDRRFGKSGTKALIWPERLTMKIDTNSLAKDIVTLGS